MPDVKLLFQKVKWLFTPQQPDSASCGVLIVAQAHNYITGNLEQQDYTVSKNDVKVMRLRMIWVITHYSKESAISKSDAVTTSAILQNLKKELD
ncbi:hypothetical protein PF001_g32566 [Phytophthora fragariae]|uniref:Ubiquitin-like protease family profile domain-containing protein n=1 Tax=Phytophthora fragariae TaxID=53985 RepID=A0A6A4ASJ7_9STRA|nr:hypothetical protein PF001_g32566 [Phytophthora fragariae]